VVSDVPVLLKIVVLNGTLADVDVQSSTSQLVDRLLLAMSRIHFIDSEVIRLRDHNIPPGTKADMGDGDEWPAINERIKAANILIMATPIWWGNRSSLIQRVIERMDASTDSAGYGDFGNVAGTLVQGDEDGGQAVQAGLMEVLTYFGFTLPPFCGVYDLKQPSMQEGLDGWIEKTAGSLIAAALHLQS
jgi:multimeric flavodoxin WrbA